MDTTKKILLGTFVIFTILIGIFVIGNLFGTSTLLITVLPVLFLLFVLLLVLLFVKKRKPLSKEEQLKIKEYQLKIYLIGGIFSILCIGYGIIYLPMLFVSGKEIHWYNYVMAVLFIAMGISNLYQYFKAKKENIKFNSTKNN